MVLVAPELGLDDEFEGKKRERERETASLRPQYRFQTIKVFPLVFSFKFPDQSFGTHIWALIRRTGFFFGKQSSTSTLKISHCLKTLPWPPWVLTKIPARFCIHVRRHTGTNFSSFPTYRAE
ncbi:hypothetical protein TWF102_004371 [Orbilia oligospora]|uniref:Uncharacterized protein n=1 Tax=Orbilia oligospora TaxID=2813651 RepID=A0A7C8NA29_ORBOL|nr:hypothetical protein TWF102_004371 [Orbilia oligospora]